MNLPFGASGSSRIRTRLFVELGTPLHATSGDSLAPLQVETSGRTEPGVREATLIINVSGGPVVTICWFAGGEGEEEPKEEGAGDVHPPEITTTMMNTASRRKLQ